MDGTEIDSRPATVGPRLVVRVAPNPRAGRDVRDRVLAFTTSLDIDEADVSDLMTALGEALANAIEHGGTTEPIEVGVWLVGEDQLVATVVDRGIGFEPCGSALVEPHLPDCFSERGRGLPIMRSCCDLFFVRSAPGRGTSVTLGRYVRTRSAVGQRFPAAG